ncbi:hypothetical protein BCR39DRAFT_517824 [Naematelia encephala]|uniref:Uncharacterized protein n=1 Tax=Naematelia encephala TaxID=71784 RepID=A0A1Y2BJP2_9TREE|nr:hypothetical protein BCR39DRAFT_517824 [Naematelia encephala]
MSLLASLTSSTSYDSTDSTSDPRIVELNTRYHLNLARNMNASFESNVPDGKPPVLFTHIKTTVSRSQADTETVGPIRLTDILDSKSDYTELTETFEPSSSGLTETCESKSDINTDEPTLISNNTNPTPVSDHYQHTTTIYVDWHLELWNKATDSYDQRASSDILALALGRRLGDQFIADPSSFSVESVREWVDSIMIDLYKSTKFRADKLYEVAFSRLDEKLVGQGWTKGQITFTAPLTSSGGGDGGDGGGGFHDDGSDDDGGSDDGDDGGGSDDSDGGGSGDGSDTSLQRLTVILWADYLTSPWFHLGSIGGNGKRKGKHDSRVEKDVEVKDVRDVLDLTLDSD